MLKSLYVLALVGVGQIDHQDAATLMRECLECRGRIISGEVSLSQEVVRAGGQVASTQYCIVFDEEHLSVDLTNGSGTRKSILTPQTVMRWNGYVEEGVVIGRRDTREGQPGPYLKVFDPRIMGMNTESPGHWYTFRWSDFLMSAPTDCALRDDSIDGCPVKHIQFTHLGNPVDIWIAADKGPSMVRAEISTSRSGKTLTDAMSCSPTLYEDSNVWFPNECVHRRTRNGDIVTEYRIRVTEARFNYNIDQSTFTLRALAPNKGAYVRQQGKPISVWDGDKAVPVAQTIAHKPTERRSLVWVSVGLFILGVAFAVVRMARARQR